MTNQELPISIALRQFRAKTFLTQQEVGQILQVSKTTVCRWEAGDIIPSLKNQRKIKAMITDRVADANNEPN